MVYIGLQSVPSKWESSLPRRLRFPDLPPGALRELLVYVHQLHQLAGGPSTRAIAEGIGERSDGEIRCSHTTIHGLLTATNPPTNGDLLFELVKYLNFRNRHTPEREKDLLDKLETLWLPASRQHLFDMPKPSDASAQSDQPTAGHGQARRSGTSRSTAGRPRITDHEVLSEPGAWAVLAGASSYRDNQLPDLPAVERGISDLGSLLSSGDSLFLPENTMMLQNATTRELLSHVDEAASLAEETLLIYYSGHGLLDNSGSLMLSTSDTEFDRGFTAAPYETVKSLVARSRAQTTIVILDACFSGRALHAMGPLSGLTPVPSTYVIASTGTNQTSFAYSGEPYTAFTGALIGVLSNGLPGKGGVLTLDDVWEGTRELCAGRDIPQPNRTSTGHAGGVQPFFRNRAPTER